MVTRTPSLSGPAPSTPTGGMNLNLHHVLSPCQRSQVSVQTKDANPGHPEHLTLHTWGTSALDRHSTTVNALMVASTTSSSQSASPVRTTESTTSCKNSYLATPSCLPLAGWGFRLCAGQGPRTIPAVKHTPVPPTWHTIRAMSVIQDVRQASPETLAPEIRERKARLDALESRIDRNEAAADRRHAGQGLQSQ